MVATLAASALVLLTLAALLCAPHQRLFVAEILQGRGAYRTAPLRIERERPPLWRVATVASFALGTVLLVGALCIACFDDPPLAWWGPMALAGAASATHGGLLSSSELPRGRTRLLAIATTGVVSVYGVWLAVRCAVALDRFGIWLASLPTPEPEAHITGEVLRVGIGVASFTILVALVQVAAARGRARRSP